MNGSLDLDRSYSIGVPESKRELSKELPDADHTPSFERLRLFSQPKAISTF